MSSAFELTQSRRTGGSETGPVSTCVANKDGVAGQPENICLLVEARGCPELDLALTGCVKGRKGWRPRCGGLPRGGAPVGRVAAGLDRVAVVEGVVLEWHLVEVRLHMCT